MYLSMIFCFKQRKNNQTYHVKIEEMDHLHYPIVGSISYTMDAKQDSIDLADDVDTYMVVGKKTLQMISVTRVQHRGDCPPSCMVIYLVNMGRQGIFCLLAVKNGMGVAT
jgi:hypothetical protein